VKSSSGPLPNGGGELLLLRNCGKAPENRHFALLRLPTLSITIGVTLD